MSEDNDTRKNDMRKNDTRKNDTRKSESESTDKGLKPVPPGLYSCVHSIHSL